jgi:HK97 family phage major capsid protein
MPLDGDEKQIIDQLGRAFEEFKATHEREVAELKKGMADVVTTEKLARIDEALNKLSEAKDALERKATERLDDLEKKLNRPGAGGRGGDPDAEAKELAAFNAERKSVAAAAGAQIPAGEVGLDEYRAYKAAFNKIIRRGNAEMLSAEERKALQVGVDSDGGYLVPADMSGRIVRRVYELSPIRAIVSVQQISTDALEGINDLDQVGAVQWVGETEQRTETATPQIGKWSIPVHEMSAEPKMTQKQLDDAVVDVEAWLGEKVADRFARGEAAAFLTGNGVAKPRGLTTYPTATTADDTRPWGTFQHVNTGASGAFAGSNPADVLFDLIGAVKDVYLQNARWLTRREVITAVRKFKGATNGDYLWQPGLQQGQPQSLLGYPITIAQDMPSLGSNSLSAAFGDFREAYMIVDRVGIRVLRDPYTAKPYIKFYTTRRVGGGALNFEAVKFLRFAAS